jgi:hypothetical protein
MNERARNQAGGVAQATLPIAAIAETTDTRIWCVRWPTDWNAGETRLEVHATDSLHDYGRIYFRDNRGNTVELHRDILWELLYTYGKDLLSLIHEDADAFRKACAAEKVGGADGKAQ